MTAAVAFVAGIALGGFVILVLCCYVVATVCYGSRWIE